MCELLTNALRHTDSGRGGQMRIRLALVDRSLWAEVADDGCSATVPHICESPDESGRDESGRDESGRDESGRGLRIVDAYADDWGVERRGPGHAVWFAISP